MPFSAISIYLFIKAIKSDKSKTKILLLLLSGLFVAIGFKIRVVVAIFLIAIIVENIINNKLSKKIIFNTSYLLIGFIIGILACKLIEMPFNIEKNKSAEMPPTHWVMMGLNKEFDGLYNDKDYSFTRKRIGYTAKVEANIKQIKKRIKNLGFKSLVPFICTKLRVNWSNGEYFHQLKYLLANVEEITDVYPHGNAIINDEEKNGDIVFSVQEESKRTYVSKSIYITLTTVILSIELFAFYPYIFQNKKNYLFLPQK